MEYVIQEETKKALDKELKKARQLRQKQVRQQTLQWSEEMRRRFDEERERQAQLKINLVTKEVEEKAKARIEHLMMVHDLALAEVGTAHRAAAQFREAEKIKELKRLQNQELAKIRGKNALSRAYQENISKAEALEEIKRRKEEVRREEDRKVKEMIEERRKRQPLAPVTDSTTNGTQTTKPKTANPKLDQRLATRLQYPGKPTSPVKRRSVKFSSPSKNVKSTQSLPSKAKGKAEPKKKPPVLAASRQETLSPVFEPKSKTGRFDKEVQKRLTRPTTPQKLDKKDLDGSAATASYHKKRGSTSSTSGADKQKREPKVVPAKDKQASTENLTRYFDTGMPRGEKNYVPPKGIAQKVEPTGSPNAWETAEKLSSESMKKLEEKARKQEELLRKASIRGEVAQEKARLERRLKSLQSQLLEEAEEFSFLGTGSQEGGLGLEERNQSSTSTGKPRSSTSVDKSQKGDQKRNSSSPENFSDLFIPLGSDEQMSISSDGENGVPGSRNRKSSEFSIPLEDRVEKSLTELEALSSSQKLCKWPSKDKKGKENLPKVSSKSKETYNETLAIIQDGLREINQVRDLNELLPVTQSVLKLQEERTRLSHEEEQQDALKPPSVLSLSRSSSSSSSSDNRKLNRKSRKVKKSQASPERVTSGQMPLTRASSIPVAPLNFDAADSKTTTESTKLASTNIPEGYTSGSTVVETKVKTRFSKDPINSTNDQNQVQDTSNASSTVEPDSKPKVKVLKKKVPKQIQDRDDSTMTSFSERSSTETPESKKGKISPDATPQGPYTSTPDGKMKLKAEDQVSSGSSTVSEGRLLGRKLTRKDLILHAKASELMQRRRESIEALPVSSSSSSNVEIHDSSVDLSNLSRSPSTTVNTSTDTRKSSKSSSSTNRTWETILEEHTLIDDSSYASDADSQFARKISEKVLRKLSELNVLSSSKSSTEDSSTIFETKINATVGSEDNSYSQNESAKTSTSAGSISSPSNSKNNTGSGSAPSVPPEGNKTSEFYETIRTESSPGSASSNPHEESYNSSNFEGTLSSPDSVTATSIAPEDISGLEGTIISSVASSSDNAQDKEVKRLLDSRGGGDDVSRVSPPVRGDTNIQEEMLAVFKTFQEELDGLYIERPPLPSWVI